MQKKLQNSAKFPLQMHVNDQELIVYWTEIKCFLSAVAGCQEEMRHDRAIACPNAWLAHGELHHVDESSRGARID